MIFSRYTSQAEDACNEKSLSSCFQSAFCELQRLMDDMMDVVNLQPNLPNKIYMANVVEWRNEIVCFECSTLGVTNTHTRGRFTAVVCNGCQSREGRSGVYLLCAASCGQVCNFPARTLVTNSKCVQLKMQPTNLILP